MSLFLQITVSGNKELKEQLQKKHEAINSNLIDAIERGCIDIENETRRVAPVEFGTLRDNVVHELIAEKNDTVFAMTNKEKELTVYGKVGVRDIIKYAEAVEVMGIRGTGKPRQHGAGIKRDKFGKLPLNPLKKMPYLLPSFNMFITKINENIAKAIVNGIEK